MSGAIPPLPNTSSWRGAELKQRGNFTFLPFNVVYMLHHVWAYKHDRGGGAQNN